MQELTADEKKFEIEVTRYFGYQPTTGQSHLFYAFTRFVFSQKTRCALLIKGYAGTGKTTSVAAMVNALAASGKTVVLLAPTGRAAKVLGNYSRKKAFTIHRQIYSRTNDSTGNLFFDLRENELKDAFFFVDEASMIGSEKFSVMHGAGSSGDLLDDLLTYIYSGENCKLVLIGDNAQLPPIGSDQSPALNLSLLKRDFNLNIAELELTEVIRQQKGSGILHNATLLREKIVSGENEIPKFQVDGFDDVVPLNSDPQPVVEEAIRNFGIDGTIIVTRSNKRANLYNQQVRSRILWHEEEINAGDRMMVLRNNYFWLDAKHPAGFIANGDAIEIDRVRTFEDKGQFRFCRATIRMIDYDESASIDVLLLCSTIWEETPSLSEEKQRALYELIRSDYQHLEKPFAIRKAIREDEYYNALQVKFAYAVTCHKAQGGQWPCVFVDQGYITDEMAGRELNRWFYTAFTRAQKELYLAGFDERFYTSASPPEARDQGNQ